MSYGVSLRQVRNGYQAAHWPKPRDMRRERYDDYTVGQPSRQAMKSVKRIIRHSERQQLRSMLQGDRDDD